MSSQVNDMQRLVESLVAGTERRVVGEKSRLEQVGLDARERLSDIAAMRADADAAVAATEEARVEQAAADAAARAEAEAVRLETAAVDARERLSDIAAMRADVAQMRADADAAVAEFSAIRVQSVGLLQTALLTISDIRSGRNAALAPKKSKLRVPRRVAEPTVETTVEPVAEPTVETTVEPVAEAGWEQDRPPNKTEIFSFIADHPDGVSLVEMEAYFGTPRIVLQRPVKEMYETDHQVTRDDQTRRYVAV